MLEAEQIQKNYDILLNYIEAYITGDRKGKMLDFYKQYEDRLILMPASTKVGHHSWFPGGYIHHVNNVVKCSLLIDEVWKLQGVDSSRYTTEELVFSAINHDLGKMGDETNPIYLPNPSQWHIENQGQVYIHSPKVQFASVPDRSLFLLQQHGIPYNFNEMIAIKIHDGLYAEANKEYLMGYSIDSKPYASLPYILHQGDLMAARIEFEQQYAPKQSVAKSEKIKPAKLDKKEKIVNNSIHGDKFMDTLKGLV